MSTTYAPGWDGRHCSNHGALGQKTKNGHCEWCWPPKPITTIEQVIDILEVEHERTYRTGMKGLAERYERLIDYLQP